MTKIDITWSHHGYVAYWSSKGKEGRTGECRSSEKALEIAKLQIEQATGSIPPGLHRVFPEHSDRV